jgi:23S rRNA A2030 N6-methylase RlmJ
MFVVNPPWQLDEELDDALPWLAERLALDAGAAQRAVR